MNYKEIKQRYDKEMFELHSLHYQNQLMFAEFLMTFDVLFESYDFNVT